jgi:hypothetical protein
MSHYFSEAIPDAGSSIPDKLKKDSFFIQYPETRIQYHVLIASNRAVFPKPFKNFTYEDV